jgi:hypothetical protein
MLAGRRRASRSTPSPLSRYALKRPRPPSCRLASGSSHATHPHLVSLHCGLGNWGALPLRGVRLVGVAAPEAEPNGHRGGAGDSGAGLRRAGDAGQAMDDAAQQLVAV